MSNQYTVRKYGENEINEIISLYGKGMSHTKISKILKRKKDNIKKILIENNVWDENKYSKYNEKKFTENEIKEIEYLYMNEKLSLKKISNKFNVSITPIKKILKKKKLLRKGYSNGVKINLTENQKNKIEKLYLNEYWNTDEIAILFNCSSIVINKYLLSKGLRRNKSEGVSVGLVKRFNNINYNEYLEKLPEYEKYKREVIKATLKNPIHLLPNYNKRGVSGIDGAYHLDHKYSICEGFKNNIDIDIIANMNNLEFIPWRINLIKKTKCSISKEELINN